MLRRLWLCLIGEAEVPPPTDRGGYCGPPTSINGPPSPLSQRSRPSL